MDVAPGYFVDALRQDMQAKDNSWHPNFGGADNPLPPQPPSQLFDAVQADMFGFGGPPAPPLFPPAPPNGAFNPFGFAPPQPPPNLFDAMLNQSNGSANAIPVPPPNLMDMFTQNINSSLRNTNTNIPPPPQPPGFLFEAANNIRDTMVAPNQSSLSGMARAPTPPSFIRSSNGSNILGNANNPPRQESVILSKLSSERGSALRFPF